MIEDRRQTTGACSSDFRDDNLVSVRVNDEIGVVCDHDHLPAPLGRLKKRDEFVVHGSRVQVLLGLVDDERPVVVIIQRKVEEDKNDSARARRQLANVCAVVADPVLDRDVVRAVQLLGEAPSPRAVVSLI